MFKPKINYRWPATLSGFSKETNENFSRAKLKVFYKGETADHRYFSDEFAQEIIGSLPYTPVVTHYDEEKQDFVGHASEQQLYGIVDPCVEPQFEKLDDGNEWCVCEVVLYTERPDTVGEIAKKIVGHSQSLELDPRTVKYVVNYDERKHFKNIEFTAGTFVGVSVLGDDQEPAFTGSAFFENNEQFNKKMEILRKYCEGKTDPQGDANMEIKDFLKLSWGEIAVKVDDAVYAEYGHEYYTYSVDYTDEYGIYKFYSYYDGSSKLMKIYYSLDENGKVTLGNINEVRVTYEDVVDASATGEGTFASQDSDNFVTDSDNFSTDSDNFAAEIEKPEETDTPIIETINAEDLATATVTTIEEESTTAQLASNLGKESTVNEGETTTQATGPASFTDSERAELEALKKEKKLALIKNYEEYLSDEEKVDFTDHIDDYTEETLELALLKAFKKTSEETFSTMAPLAVPEPQIPETADNQLNSYIRRMLRK